jgi:GTP-binding protein
MDSMDQEKERGITITAKHTTVHYKDYKINIIDTPGHADFSGEVERVLGMVNCVLLLVDAQEGPMPQTRFVLSKALKMGLKPIVVLNKIDRPHANPNKVLDLTLELFMELGATDDQLDFHHIYASGYNGYAVKGLNDERKDLVPLFDLIIERVPAPPGSVDSPFIMQAATLSYNDHFGRQATGRVLDGKISKNESIIRVDRNGNHKTHKVVKIEGHIGLKKIEMEDAGAGDIITISGCPEVEIGDTLQALCSPDKIRQLDPIEIAEPTMSCEFMVNTSPKVGQDGKHVTMSKLHDRLMKEKRGNISLKIEPVPGREDAIRVAGRGELHLAVLIETMRREDYELAISKPKVITREENGVTMEPIERVHVEVREEYSGTIINDLSLRKAELKSMDTSEHGLTTMIFSMPTRGLMGYRNDFLTRTRGTGILTSIFEAFAPWKGEIVGRLRGVLISNGLGKANAYSLNTLQDKSTLFVGHNDEVYEGMVVGENSRDNDLVVNVIKAKQLTNVRASGSDEGIFLTPPRPYTLEQAIDYIADDELVEVTPNHIRMRKIYLNETDRKRYSR